MDTLIGKKLKKTKGAPFLPDEIITNILIMLPAKSAMRCRLVCRRWRDLTVARDFVELQLRNNIPTILVATSKEYSILNFFAVDKWWEPTGTRYMIHKFPFYSGKFKIHRCPCYPEIYPKSYSALFSHAGLIVSDKDADPSLQTKFIIFNPIRPRRECVTITLSKKLRGSKIYGVYYHPSLKEYCSLWKIKASGSNHIQYKMLNLGSNPSFKTISNPFSNRVEKEYSYPLFINNCIYWLLKSNQSYGYNGHNDIMEFDIIKEEFMVIPCPVPLNTVCMRKQTHLLSIDNILCFMLILSSKIVIWRLEDHAEKLWTNVEYTLSREICNSYKTAGGMYGIAGVDGKLALPSNKRFLVCNPMEGSVKNYPEIECRVKKYQKKKYHGDVLYFSHQMSLASLKNCTSKIFIDKDCKVVVKRKRKRTWKRDQSQIA